MAYTTFHDISYANGKYNMDGDPSPIVEMKMTGYYYGSKTPYTDVQGATNYSNAIRTGKIPILYHFAGGADPVAEADYFINTGAMPFANGDIYELDYELTDDMGPPADPDGWCRSFADRVKERSGVYPLLYINTSTFLRYNKFPRTMEVCALIIADYRYTPDQDVPCDHPYIIHQYTDTPLDTNACFIDLDTLRKYAYGYQEQAPTPPAPTPNPVPTPPAPAPDPIPPSPAPPEVPPSNPPPIENPPVESPPVPQDPQVGWLVRAIKAILRFLHIRSPK